MIKREFSLIFISLIFIIVFFSGCIDKELSNCVNSCMEEMGQKSSVMKDVCTKLCKENSLNNSDINAIPTTTIIETKIYDLSDFPNIFIENEKTNLLVVAGEDAPTNDFIIAIGIASKLIDLAPKGYPETIVFLDKEIENTTNQPLILIGGPNVNSLTALALNVSYPTSINVLEIPERGAIIKIINNAFGGEYPTIIIAGNDEELTCLAGDILVNYNNYNLGDSELIVDKSLVRKIDEPICEMEISIS